MVRDLKEKGFADKGYKEIMGPFDEKCYLDKESQSQVF